MADHSLGLKWVRLTEPIQTTAVNNRSFWGYIWTLVLLGQSDKDLFLVGVELVKSLVELAS
jgi:hypothetical protein